MSTKEKSSEKNASNSIEANCTAHKGWVRYGANLLPLPTEKSSPARAARSTSVHHHGRLARLASPAEEASRKFLSPPASVRSQTQPRKRSHQPKSREESNSADHEPQPLYAPNSQTPKLSRRPLNSEVASTPATPPASTKTTTTTTPGISVPSAPESNATSQRRIQAAPETTEKSVKAPINYILPLEIPIFTNDGSVTFDNWLSLYRNRAKFIQFASTQLEADHFLAHIGGNVAFVVETTQSTTLAEVVKMARIRLELDNLDVQVAEYDGKESIQDYLRKSGHKFGDIWPKLSEDAQELFVKKYLLNDFTEESTDRE